MLLMLDHIFVPIGVRKMGVPRVESHLICFRRQYSVALEARTNDWRDTVVD
jgi:hypothetical protein